MNANLIEASLTLAFLRASRDGALRGGTIDDLDADQCELFSPIGSILESTFLSTSNLESSFIRAVVQRC
jgi:hypothetical protein